MEQIKKSTMNMCLVVVFLLFVLTKFSKATSIDQHIQKRSVQGLQEGDSVEQTSAWQILFQAQLRRELAELDEAEKQILNQMDELNNQRNTIREKKRGHTQCFLNLVSCYRKRK